jgi:hypothetical protein
MPKKKGVTDTELTALLDGQIADAKDYDGADLSSRRIKALEYEEGIMRDVPALPGRSSFVSRDVADTIGLIEPGVARTFFSADEVVKYEATKQENEEHAQQATDYINYVVMRECDGYRQLKFGIRDGLRHGNGIIKHYWDPTVEYTTERFTGLTDQAYNELVADEEVEEVLEHSEYPDPSLTYASAIPDPALVAATAPGAGAPVPGGMLPTGVPMGAAPSGGNGQAPPPGAPGAVDPNVGFAPAAPASAGGPPVGAGGNAGAGVDALGALAGLMGNGGPMGAPGDGGGLDGAGGESAAPPMLHDCKIKRVCTYGRLRLEVLPPEQFLIDRDARVLDEENVKFAAHHYKKTRSQLIEEGYDRDVVEDLPAHTSLEEGEDAVRLGRMNIYNSADKSTDLIEIYECYVKADMNGDGVAEWVMAVMAGASGTRSLLTVEEWGDDLPFSDIVPDPQPHKWVGRSIFDEVEDIQRVKTVLQRGILDNLYWVNNPQRLVFRNAIENMDEVINPTFGGSVYANQMGEVITPLAVPFVADKVFPALEAMDAVIEKRTGITRQTAALDLDALQNQTATATNAMQSAAHTKIEEYARNIAECGGFKRIFKCVLKLIIKHQDKPRTIKLRGDWVEMDPRAWNANMDVTINTGLGSGSRDKDLQMLQGIAQKQELTLSAMGPGNPLLGPDKLFLTYRKMAEAAGVKSPEQFFPEIGEEELQKVRSAPDPRKQEMQAKFELEKSKAMAAAQLEQQKLAMQNQHAAQEWQAKQAAENAKAQRDAQAQQMQLDRQAMIEERQAQADIEVERQKAQVTAELERERAMHAQALAEKEFQHNAQLAWAKHEADKELKLLDIQMKERLAQQQHEMSMLSGERQFAWSAQQEERGHQMQKEAAERDFAQNMHKDERAHEMSQEALAAKMDGAAE